MTDDAHIDRNNGAKTEGRNPDGTFAPGNPGRPSGARHKTTLAVLSLLDGQAEALTQKAVDMALEGDTTAMRLCLERIAPARKDTAISVSLPRIESAADAAEAAAAIVNEVTAGEITPVEGAAVMGLLDQYRRTLEASDFEARLQALEKGR